MFAEKKVRRGGTIAVVTFHSLEDKIVKDFGKIMSGKATSINRYRPLVSESYPSLMPVNKKPVVDITDSIPQERKKQKLETKSKSCQLLEVN